MKQAQLTKIELCKLKAFADHPYKVQDDAEMDALTESIRENGVLAPLLVRPLNNRKGEYEIVSGHRRMRAAERAGLSVVPAFVSELDLAAAGASEAGGRGEDRPDAGGLSVVSFSRATALGP